MKPFEKLRGASRGDTAAAAAGGSSTSNALRPHSKHTGTSPSTGTPGLRPKPPNLSQSLNTSFGQTSPSNMSMSMSRGHLPNFGSAGASTTSPLVPVPATAVAGTPSPGKTAVSAATAGNQHHHKSDGAGGGASKRMTAAMKFSNPKNFRLQINHPTAVETPSTATKTPGRSGGALCRGSSNLDLSPVAYTNPTTDQSPVAQTQGGNGPGSPSDGISVEELLPTDVPTVDMKHLDIDADVHAILGPKRPTTPKLVVHLDPPLVECHAPHQLISIQGCFEPLRDLGEVGVDRAFHYQCVPEDTEIFDVQPWVDNAGTLHLATNNVDAETVVWVSLVDLASLDPDECRSRPMSPVGNEHGGDSPRRKVPNNALPRKGISPLGDNQNLPCKKSKPKPISIRVHPRHAKAKKLKDHRSYLERSAHQAVKLDKIFGTGNEVGTAGDTSPRSPSPSGSDDGANAPLSRDDDVRFEFPQTDIHDLTQMAPAHAAIRFPSLMTVIERFRIVHTMQERDSLGRPPQLDGVLGGNVRPQREAEEEMEHKLLEQLAYETDKSSNDDAVAEVLMRLATHYISYGSAKQDEALQTIEKLIATRLKPLNLASPDEDLKLVILGEATSEEELKTGVGKAYDDRLEPRVMKQLELLAHSLHYMATYLKLVGHYHECVKYLRRCGRVLSFLRGDDSVAFVRNLSNTAEVYCLLEDYRAAAGMYQLALASAEVVWGADGPSTVALLHYLGLALVCDGQPDKGLELHERAYHFRKIEADEMSTLSSEPNSPSAKSVHLLIESLHFIAHAHLEAGRFERSKAVAEECMVLVRSTATTKTTETTLVCCSFLLTMQAICLQSHDLAQALAYAQQAAADCRRVRGGDAVESLLFGANEIAMTIKNVQRNIAVQDLCDMTQQQLENTWFQLKDALGVSHPCAMKLHLVVLQLRSQLTGFIPLEDLDSAQGCWDGLAVLMQQESIAFADVAEAFCAVALHPPPKATTFNLRLARSCATRALNAIETTRTILLKKHCVDLTRITMAMTLLCGAYSVIHFLDKIDRKFHHNHDVMPPVPDDNTLAYADAVARQALRDYEKAKIVPPMMPHVVALRNLGELYFMRGELERAHHYLSKALKAADKHSLIFLLGHLFKPATQLTQSEVLERNRMAADRLSPALSQMFAGILFSIGVVYEAEGKVDEAEATFVQCLAGLEIAGEHHSIGTTLSLRALGRLLHLRGYFGDALAYFERSYNILLEFFPLRKDYLDAALREVNGVNSMLQLVGYALVRHVDGKMRFPVYL